MSKSVTSKIPITFADAGGFGLSKLEYACIHLRIPRTGDPELDALIAAAQRRDAAARMWPSSGDSDDAIECANHLIAAPDKEAQR